MAARGTTGSFRPVDAAALADHVTGRVCARPGRVRVLLDGPPPSAPRELADDVAQRVRLRGRAAVVVDAGDYLRPASVRLELGHTDPDMFLDGWVDEDALRREVLGPAGADGSGMVLPRLWDADRDRSYRDRPQPIGPDGVVLLAGSRLLGRGLACELAVHLRMAAAALARHLPGDDHWMLQAFARYEDERDPIGSADVLVMADHPDRRALRDRDGGPR
ncbi:uridine kinase [Pseudonocardia sp. KRD291]|uniref:uridine kinase n=1 Tax=Pseudonocardia sp. KRD291 TaxID=2792007 RepID=UPI001C49F624|nr:uridine kinase [Pseudonocardia sp. KRD291]MBW0106206.1 uridine kinase [Pseudonocardia sp. KRD291]